MLPYKILITSPARFSIKNLHKTTKCWTSFKRSKKQGFELIEFPTIKIIQSKKGKALAQAIHKINSYDYLIFTSRNSANFFMQRFFAEGKTNKDLKGIKICAIGKKTAEEIKKWKVKVDLIPDEFNAEGLVKKIVKVVEWSSGQVVEKQKKKEVRESRRQRFKGLRFLLPRGEKAREILPEKIRKLGGKIDSPVLYKTVKPTVNKGKIKKVLDQKFSAAAFTSASAFNNFIEIIGEKVHKFLKNTSIAVIGPVTAKAVRKAGFKVSIMPRTATIEAMSNEIIKHLNKNKKSACNK